MADTTFISGTVITSDWLNDANDVVYGNTRVSATVDYAVPNNGTTSATSAIQTMFDACAADGNVSEIYFPDGTYLLTNPNNDSDYTCAIIISALKNVRIYGSKNTKFIVNATGVGSSEFGMFRIEQCENLEFDHFEMDGSGITITGTGSNRSRGFVLVNYNVNSKAIDLASLNKQIEFHHIYAHDIGGFVGVPSRSSILAATPYTDILTVRDCIGSNFIGQDHYVGGGYIRNAHIYNNRVVNQLTSSAQVGNLFCDLSAGCENGLVENNYAYGFTGGAKAETHTLQGPASNEDRISKNICFQNNIFEQIGDPVTVSYLGPWGGGWYGIKLNGVNHSAINNTIIARSISITTGGLYQGIQLGSTAVTPVESLHEVRGNSITGTVTGVNHDTVATDTLHKYVANIVDNKIYDTVLPSIPVADNDGAGIIVSRNAKVRNNSIYRTPYCAITINSADQTSITDNIAYNCANVSHPVAGATVVYAQEGSGTVEYFEFVNNKIIDTRGASAAEYGYFLRAGTTYTNPYRFDVGYSSGLLTAVAFDKYISQYGDSLINSGITGPGPRTFISTNSPALAAPWNAITWRVGDRAVFATPTVGVPKAWICTVAGTPGTWVSEGNL